MNFRTKFAAMLFCTLAFLSESAFMNAADKNPLEPGPADKDAPKEFTTTKSGLKYRVLRKSNDVKPTEKDTVKVHYKGWLDSGKPFDTSYGKDGDAIEFHPKQHSILSSNCSKSLRHQSRFYPVPWTKTHPRNLPKPAAG